MKRLIYFILIVSTACGVSENESSQAVIPNISVEASTDGLSKNKALVYFKDSLFSGFLTNHFADGSIQSKSGYLYGKLQGESVQYYENGQLKEKRFYDNNKKVGHHKGLWPNGNKKFEYYFEAGLHEGELKEWYETGEPFRFFHYKNGKEEGSQKMWQSDGIIRANYVVKEGHRYGLIGLKNCKSVTDEEGLFTAVTY